jgi:putative ABC transport system permease protein
MVNDLVYRVRALFRRRRVEDELDDELRFHFEREVEKLAKGGWPRAEAVRQARIHFGGVENVKEECREARGVELIDTLLRDVRHSLRMLRKAPGFAFVAVLTLALGIGANTAIFSVIDSVLLSPPPYADPGRLVAMKQNDSLQNIISIERETKTFVRGGGATVDRMDYIGGAEPAQVRAAYVSAGLLETLGMAPMLGRLIAREEDVKGGPRNMVVTHHFWQEFLSGDPHALGRSVVLNGQSYTVIGVMPRGFDLPEEHADIFVSLWVAYPDAAPWRGVHFMRTYWRLKPGVPMEQAQADMTGIATRLASEYPETEGHREKTIKPLHEWLVGDVRPALLVLFGSVGLVLLIACANFAGLLTARSIARRQEFVIRASLGAGRSRLIRQTLTESAMLALLGGVAGLPLAKWGTSFLVSLKPEELEQFSGIHFDGRLFLFVFGISLATGAVFGLIPALGAARANTVESLKESGRSVTAGRFAQALRNGLVAAEFALALILLVGAGLLIKGFARLQSVNPGFNAANLMTLHLQLPATRYSTIPPQTAFRRQLLERLNALPGVQAAMITDLPLTGNFLNHRLVIDGRPPVRVGDEPAVQTLSVMGDYFRVMQIPVVAGRGLTEQDREGQPLVAVISEEMARKFFPNENPLGARIDWTRKDQPHPWMTIVGVVRDVKHTSLHEPVEAAVYAPFSQTDEGWRRWMSVAIRTTGLAGGLVQEVKQQVWAVDRQIPVTDVRSMEDLMRVSVARHRFNMLLLGLFAGLALVLAAVGIYGTMAYRVGQRRHEIGICMALGAQRRDVLGMVLGDGARLAMVGIGVGVLGALALTRVMGSLLFEVAPSDPGTFVAMTAVLACAGLVACLVPAWRAARVDPLVALRYE